MEHEKQVSMQKIKRVWNTGTQAGTEKQGKAMHFKCLYSGEKLGTLNNKRI